MRGISYYIDDTDNTSSHCTLYSIRPSTVKFFFLHSLIDAIVQLESKSINVPSSHTQKKGTTLNRTEKYKPRVYIHIYTSQSDSYIYIHSRCNERKHLGVSATGSSESGLREAQRCFHFLPSTANSPDAIQPLMLFLPPYHRVYIKGLSRHLRERHERRPRAQL